MRCFCSILSLCFVQKVMDLLSGVSELGARFSKNLGMGDEYGLGAPISLRRRLEGCCVEWDLFGLRCVSVSENGLRMERSEVENFNFWALRDRKCLVFS